MSSSEIERVTLLGSRDVAEIASICGWHGIYGQPLGVGVGVALNVLILSIFRNHGIELPGMRRWLPGLRNEALLVLARQHANWRYDGPAQHEMAFYAKLSGPDSQVRADLARLLGISVSDTTALLRFHSPSDVETYTNEQLARGHSGRPPLFTIYASQLADQIGALVGKPLFISNPK